jgi:hypothetical protein
MIGNELAAFLARVLFTKQMPSVGCRGDVHWWPKVLTARLVRFSASLYYIRRARATLARLYGHASHVSLVILLSCARIHTTAVWLRARSLLAETECAHVHAHTS